MKNFELIKKPPDVSHNTWAERIDMCGSLLYIHGYITESQRSKITLKLEDQLRHIDANEAT